MPPTTSRNAGLYVGEESTFGTLVARSNHRPAITADPRLNPQRSPVNDLYRSGAGSALRHTLDKIEASIRASCFASYSRTGMLYKHMIGSVTGAGPWVYVPAALPTGLSVEIPRGSGANASVGAGAKINTWTWTSSASSPRAVLDLDFWCQNITRPVKTAFSNGGDDDIVLHHQVGAVSFNGVDYKPASIRINGGNALQRVWTNGETCDDFLEGDRVYGASFDFYDEGDDNFFDALVAGTQGDVAFTYTSGAKSLAWLLRNCIVNGPVSAPFRGSGGVMRTVNFLPFADASDEALGLTVTNAESSGTVN